MFCFVFITAPPISSMEITWLHYNILFCIKMLTHFIAYFAWYYFILSPWIGIECEECSFVHGTFVCQNVGAEKKRDSFFFSKRWRNTLIKIISYKSNLFLSGSIKLIGTSLQSLAEICSIHMLCRLLVLFLWSFHAKFTKLSCPLACSGVEMFSN